MTKLLIICLGFILTSCLSSDEETCCKGPKTMSFDMYNQTLESIMESVAGYYDLDLNYDAQKSSRRWSISVRNGDINDILKKISAVSGLHLKMEDDTIIIQEELFEGNSKKITLALNKNLWDDLSLGGIGDPTEDDVERFFGPLLQKSEVIDIDRSSGTMELRILPENEDFIQQSLQLLNYTQQTRKVSVSVIVVETGDPKDLDKKEIDQNNLKFHWAFKAGDNVELKLKNNTPVTIKSTDLSAPSQLNEKAFELSFTYGQLNSTRVFKDSFADRKVIKLDDNTYLLVKANWYINGTLLKTPQVSSDLFQKDIKTDFSKIPATSIKVSGSKTPVQWSKSLNTESVKIKYVHFAAANSFKQVTVELKSNSLVDSLKQLCEKAAMTLEVHKNGILLTETVYPGKLPGYWKFSTVSSENFTFLNGAFVSNTNDKIIFLLPSANAVLSSNPFK